MPTLCRRHSEALLACTVNPIIADPWLPRFKKPAITKAKKANTEDAAAKTPAARAGSKNKSDEFNEGWEESKGEEEDPDRD